MSVDSMCQLTIVAEDSPLQQKAQRAFLSESGWKPCGDIWSEMEFLDFPASNSTPQPRPRQRDRPPFVVIKVDKRSRLLTYESQTVRHATPTRKSRPGWLAAVVYVLPPENRPQAESLLSQLRIVETQDQEFYEADEPDTISAAAHNYRQRRRQDILAELIELKEDGTRQ